MMGKLFGSHPGTLLERSGMVEAFEIHMVKTMPLKYWIFPFKMLIFHSYVSLPEGTYLSHIFPYVSHIFSYFPIFSHDIPFHPIISPYFSHIFPYISHIFLITKPLRTSTTGTNLLRSNRPKRISIFGGVTYGKATRSRAACSQLMGVDILHI